MQMSYYTVSQQDTESPTQAPPIPLETLTFEENGQTHKESSPISKRTMPSNSNILVIVGIVVGAVGLLLAILMPMSFSTLEYHQLGFKRQKSTGEIKRDEVFGPGGRHLVGPDYEFRDFQYDAHIEEYQSIQVFAADRLQVSISCQLQYFLRKHQLALLHRKYDIQYASILRNNALDAIKNRATQFETREFIRERDTVEKALFHAVRERLGGPCCEKDCELTGTCWEGCLNYRMCKEEQYGLFVEARYFQLGDLSIPRDLEDKFLRGLILQEEAETEKYKQEAQVVRKETDAMVKSIENEATEISQNATAQSTLIGSVSRANATALVERSRTSGLKHLYTETGITTQAHKASFDYLRTLQAQDNVYLAVDYTQLIQGPMQLGGQP